MRCFMKVGPIEFEDAETTTAYLAIGDEGVDTVFADSDRSGLEQLLAKRREEAVCEPALKSAARKLGLRVERPSPPALAFKAGFAIVIAHGTMLELDNLPLVIDLAEAFVAFLRAEPWMVFEADEVLGVDLQKPARSYEGCVMGQLGEAFGLALYHQQGSVQAIRDLTEAERGAEEVMFPCTSVLVEHEPAFVLEAMKDFVGLAVAPGLLHFRHGEPTPMEEGDVAAVVASLKAVTALSMGQPGSGSAEMSKGRLTARVSKEVSPQVPVVDQAGVGRNDPCPCGSGKKYKRCHMGAAAEAPSGPGQTWHERDHRLIETLVAFTKRRFSAAAMKRMGPETFGAREPQIGLVGPLASYEWPVEGRPVVAHFLDEQGASLDAADRQWLEAQTSSRLGVWEVLRVDPGEGLEVLNLLTSERKYVREKKGSLTLAPRDVMLARVVDAPDMSLLGGSHLSPLPPREADAVVRGVKAEALEPGWPTTLRLLELWDEAVSQRALELASPTRVRNTDGHDAAMLEDEFALKRGSLASALSRITALEGAELSGEDARGAHVTFTRTGNSKYDAWKNTVLGSVRLTKTKLIISTNSRERADALRERVMGALQEIATHRGRTEQPLPTMRGGRDLMIDSQSVASTSTVEVYRGWLDTEIPMLDGRTPRAAISDPAAVPTIHLMLKEMENMAARSPNPEGYDFKQFRRELGLDEYGARGGDHDLDRALGHGRKISETLLDFARPLIDESGSSERDFEAALRFATVVWNIAVAQERGWAVGQVDKMRAELTTKAFAARLLKAYDALVGDKGARFSGDLRMVGKWQVKRSRGRVGVEMVALLPPELIARATAAGLRP